MSELELKVHEHYCEQLKAEADIHKTISGVIDLISALREEVKSLRTDVDKLIENSQGSLKKTA